MARIRSIKPEFFTHPEVVALSIHARLLFISLLTQADDAGRLYDQPTRIRGEAFGEGDHVNIQRLLDELAGQGRIRRYEANGRACLQIVNFSAHQRVQHPTASRIPPEALTKSSGEPREALTPSRARAEQGTGNREQGTGNRDHVATVAVQRSRDEVWDACLEVCGIDASLLSTTQRKEVNGLVASLRSRGQSGDDVRRHAANTRQRWPEVPLTLKMLLAHYAETDEPYVAGIRDDGTRMLLARAAQLREQEGGGNGAQRRDLARREAQGELPASDDG